MSQLQNKLPLTVYLDTSDYSRFGDVIRGKGDNHTETIYNKLIEFRSNGDVHFVYSLPIISELFQFDPQFPATTESKAEVVEKLCGENAFFWPWRSLAFDISMCWFQSNNSNSQRKPISIDSQWYPNTSKEVGDLKKTLESYLGSELRNREFVNRKRRRSAEANVRKFDFTQIAQPLIDEISLRYQLHPTEVRRSILPTLKGSISSAEGARRMFSAIAKPTAFVRSYFREDNEDQGLPNWMSDLGVRIQKSLLELKSNLDLLDQEEVRRESPNLIKTTSIEIMRVIFRASLKECEEFGLSEDEFFRRANEVDYIESIDSFSLFMRAYMKLVEQSIGLHGAGHGPERSAGADLLHLLYLPHCDLWRGDRRFCNIIAGIASPSVHAVVNKLSHLPDRIKKQLTASDEC